MNIPTNLDQLRQNPFATNRMLTHNLQPSSKMYPQMPMTDTSSLSAQVESYCRVNAGTIGFKDAKMQHLIESVNRLSHSGNEILLTKFNAVYRVVCGKRDVSPSLETSRSISYDSSQADLRRSQKCYSFYLAIRLVLFRVSPPRWPGTDNEKKSRRSALLFPFSGLKVSNLCLRQRFHISCWFSAWQTWHDRNLGPTIFYRQKIRGELALSWLSRLEMRLPDKVNTHEIF